MRQYRNGKRRAGSAVLILGLSVAGGAFAERAKTVDGDTLIGEVFSVTAASEVRVLRDRAMAETEGERWPFAFAEAAAERPLATYSWTTVVPEITSPWSGGVCSSCGWRNRLPR